MNKLFIVEGLDGTGKSTLVNEICHRLPVDSWVYQTKEPGLTVKMGPCAFNRPGLDIRSIVLNDKTLTPFERELMFYVDASQHQSWMNNQEDTIFVSDRGLWSHYAYLRATLKMGQIDNDQYVICKDIIDRVCAKPNKVIYLRGSLDLMERRNKNKAKDVIESNNQDYFGYVLETYEDLAFENENCLILNADSPLDENVTIAVNYIKEEVLNGNRTERAT